jgi:prepilin peptidase CpaA
MGLDPLTIAHLVLKAVAIGLLLRIGVIDFREHKIHNSNVMALLVVAVALVPISIIREGGYFGAGITIAMSAALFAVLFLFWLGGKVGAGDVKLLAIVPMLVGYQAMLPLAIAMLAFSMVVFFVMKYPVLVPESWFRTYIQGLGTTGRIPFGVPIAAATILTLVIASVPGPDVDRLRSERNPALAPGFAHSAAPTSDGEGQKPALSVG